MELTNELITKGIAWNTELVVPEKVSTLNMEAINSSTV